MGKSGISARRAARIRAFQVLYGLHFSEVKTLGALKRLFDQTPLPEDTTRDLAESSRVYAWELVEGTWQRGEELDALIAGFSKNWRVERMGRVELTLLRLAMFELACRPDVPPKVAINEALELTARFGDDKSKKFINGILDAAVKEAENGGLSPGR